MKITDKDRESTPAPFAPGTAVWVYEVPGGYLVTPAKVTGSDGRCPNCKPDTEEPS